MLPTVIPVAREGFQTVLRGRASWYGKFFQGKKTASGEPYDRFQYTCAHKKLPFGTRLRVTNLANGITVVVRVTDRGPYRKERIIDLSEKAAAHMGLTESGSASIIAVVVPDTTPLGLTDKPADLDVLRAADPAPAAPFTAYLLPLGLEAAPALAAVPAASPASLAAPAHSQQVAAPSPTFVLEAGQFADLALAQMQAARIKAIAPALSSQVETVVVAGQATNQVLIKRLESLAMAEAVRRHLLAWGVVSRSLAAPSVPSQPVLSMATP